MFHVPFLLRKEALFELLLFVCCCRENIAGLLKFLIEGNEALELCLSY